VDRERRIVLDSGSAALLIWNPGESELVAEQWAGNTLVRIDDDLADVGIFVETGNQYGPFSVTTRDPAAEPPIEQDWEDVVEFSVATDSALEISEPEDRYPSVTLVEEPGSYRIRVSARGRNRDGSFHEGDDPIEWYLVEAWPEPARPGAIVRMTSVFALNELAGPPPRPDIPEAPAGLAASVRIGRDVDGAVGARVLSGATGSCAIECHLDGPRRRWAKLLENQMTWVSWWSHEPTGWSYHGPGDPDELGWARYGQAFPDAHVEDQLSGFSCALRVAVIERDGPAQFVRAWNWVRQPPPGTYAPDSEWAPVLPEMALQTTRLTQSKGSQGEVTTHVQIEHTRLPIEWIDDMAAWWKFQLAIARATSLKRG
jgi:hypothetical protein